MPVLQINAVKDRPVLSGAMTLGKSLDHHIAALPPDAPVIVLVHGYKFSPFDQRRDPHENILSMAPKSRLGVISWPRHLGFGRGRAEEGLCIGFGWKARGTFWQAYGEAELAGAALADLIARIADRTDRKVHLVAHSLGARVALAGIAAAPAGAVGRCILMAAAEFQTPALRCLEKPAGQRVEIVNITSRENDIFDVMVERLIRPLGGARALGAGLPQAGANWLDLQIDHAPTRIALAGLGHRIAEPERRICHWSGYLRPGLFGFYTDLLRRPEALPMPLLKTLLPEAGDARWSRLFSPPAVLAPLPFLRKASF